MSNEIMDMGMMESIILPEDLPGGETPVEPQTIEQPNAAIDTPPVEDTPPDPVVPDTVDLSDIDADPIDTPPSEEVNPEVYSALVGVLKEEGFFGDEVDLTSINDPQKLADAFREEMKKNELSDLTDSQKRALEGFRNGIPQAEIVEHETTMTQYSQITDDVLAGSDELQKALFMADMTNKGISERRAEMLFTIAYDNGELLDEAKTSLTVLKEKEVRNYQDKMTKQTAANDAAKQDVEDKKIALKKSIYGVDKFMGDVAISENLKERIHKSITHVVEYADDGTPMNALMKAKSEDPLDFETKLYYLFELTDGFSNLKKFNKRAESKAAKKLESIISNNTFIKSSDATSTVDPNSFDPGSIQSLI